MDDKEIDGKLNEEHSDNPGNPGNPGPSEADFAVAQERLANVIAMMAQVEKDMRMLTKHSAVCAERWRQHAEEHQRMQTSARASDAGNFAWAGIAAFLSYYLGR